MCRAVKRPGVTGANASIGHKCGGCERVRRGKRVDKPPACEFVGGREPPNN